MNRLNAPCFRARNFVFVVLATAWLRVGVAQEPKAEIPDSVVAAFKKANKNGDQTLSIDEFIAGRGAADVAKRDFKLYDANEDGALSLEEFASARGAMALDQPGVLPDFLTSYVDQSVAALDKAFGNWDQNPQKEINAAQFLSAFIQELQAQTNNSFRPNLREADPNQDQQVSRAEARRFIEIQLGIRRSDGKPLRFPNGMVVNHHLWLHADADKNDVLDKTEYRERSYAGDKWEEEFSKLNLDGDEVVSFDEFCRLPWRGFTDPVVEFRTMDRNLDARLDREELLAGTPDWKKKLAEHAFPGFDLNQDGVLSLVEYCLTPQANMVLSWTSVLTDNGDESISFPEFKFGGTEHQFKFPLLRILYFHRFDTNGDKLLMTDEFYFKLKARPEFYIMNEDGTGWASFFKLEKRDVGSPAISPDGKSIAFDSYVGTSEGDKVYVMDMIEKKPRELGLGLMPNWAPDSKRLAITRSVPQRGAWTINADTSNPEFHAAGWGAQMSPDGKRISYYNGNAIYAFNREKKEVETLLPSEESPYQQFFWNMCWSPDSSKICIKGMKADSTQEMVIIDLMAKPKPTLKARAVTKTSMMEDAAWHPNGRRIVIGMHCDERKRMQMYEFDPETDDPPTLVKGQDPERHNGGGCWTPDGKRMIVVSRSD